MVRTHGAVSFLAVFLAAGCTPMSADQPHAQGPAPVRFPVDEFAFLRKRDPVPESSTLAYSFKADGSAVVAEAKRVFRLNGYSIKEKHDDGSALKADGDDEVIDVFVNSRWDCTSDGTLCSRYDEPGSVCVIFWQRDRKDIEPKAPPPSQ